MLLKSPVTISGAPATDNCNSALSVQALGPAKRSFLMTPVPNPATSATVFVDLGLDRHQQVRLELLDQQGNVAATIMRGIDLGAGLHRVSFDISDLESGSYFCRLVTQGGEAFVQKMIVGR